MALHALGAQVWVANHTSIIDYVVLSAAAPFACIMQLQPGFLGFLQTRVLPCIGGLFFNRTEVTYGCATTLTPFRRMQPIKRS